ncbi:hypothetical protein [Candidatus Thioglobus sp.]|jgi:hypothetical protein|uniref:hypothetical protein n=1 Tax=Candidatus Thioglobus sp. TaxID=2026721 RepID=UPI0025C173F4|nr:hypothetical protein [Candidatus Thioglobus sp.]
MQFLELEGGYLAIAGFVLLVTMFVTTRSFMPKGAFKKGMVSVLLVLILFIGLHFNATINRMQSVASAFNNGEDIICENRVLRKAAQSFVINRSRGWLLANDIFSSSEYNRVFHSARCLVVD